MKFDIVMGNPPYNQEKNTKISRNAKSLYLRFIDKIKTLSPIHTVLVIPYTWMVSKKAECRVGRGNIMDMGCKEIIHTGPNTFGKSINVDPVILVCEDGYNGDIRQTRWKRDGKEINLYPPHKITTPIRGEIFPLSWDEESNKLGSNIKLKNNLLKIKPGNHKVKRGFKDIIKDDEQTEWGVSYAYLTGMESPLYRKSYINNI